MNTDDLREILDREPFEPFRLVTSSGESYEVRDPHAVAIMQSRLFVALPTDRWVILPYLHINAVENLSNGHPRRRRKR